MRVAITHVQIIKAKKSGVEWAKISVVNPENGQTDSYFVQKSQYDSFNVSDSVVSEADIKSVFANIPLIKVEFGRRGELVSMS